MSGGRTTRSQHLKNSILGELDATTEGEIIAPSAAVQQPAVAKTTGKKGRKAVGPKKVSHIY